MASNTSRFSLNTYDQGDTGWDHTDVVEHVDENAIGRGTFSGRPSNGTYNNELYYATDVYILYRWDDNTGVWEEVSGFGTNSNSLTRTPYFDAIDLNSISSADVTAITIDGNQNVRLENGDLEDDSGNTIYDLSNNWVPQTRLQNDSLTVSAGNGLKDGGSVSLGGSTTVNIEPADFAGSGLSDDGSDDLQVNLGNALSLDGSDSIEIPTDAIQTGELDLSITPTWTGQHTFNSGIDVADELREDGVLLSRDADATFYVDEANGNDTNDGTTASSAFASYERALEEVARFTDGIIQIRQIGDYNSEVKVQGRFAGPQSARDIHIEILGDSEKDGRYTDASNMESINATVRLYASTGINLNNLHLNGRVWIQGVAPFQLGRCKLGSDGTLFVYCKGSQGDLAKCGFDPQSQDPDFGVVAFGSAVVGVGGNTTFDNWDPSTKDTFFGNAGIVFDDEWEDGNEYKEGDLGRRGNVFPTDGFVLGAPAIDRGLRGKPLTEVGGETDAANGDVRAANGASIQARNAADTADFGITFNANDKVETSASVVPDAAGTKDVGTSTTHFNEMHAADFISHSPSPRDSRVAWQTLDDYTEHGYGSMNMAEMIANLITVVDEQQAQIEELRGQIR